MIFQIKLYCNNAAFEDGNLQNEIARILKEVSEKIQNLEYTGKYQNVKDINGNIIGTFKLGGEY